MKINLIIVISLSILCSFIKTINISNMKNNNENLVNTDKTEKANEQALSQAAIKAKKELDVNN